MPPRWKGPLRPLDDTAPLRYAAFDMSNTEQNYCLCGCGCVPVKSDSRFCQGHDQRAYGMALRAVREGTTAELSKEVREYGRERGLAID